MKWLLRGGLVAFIAANSKIFFRAGASAVIIFIGNLLYNKFEALLLITNPQMLYIPLFLFVTSTILLILWTLVSLKQLSSFAESKKIYQDFSKEEEQLTSLFKHVKYYIPKFKEPNVVTILSNIDYESRVIYADSLLLISLDVYLGKNHPFYGDYPAYIKENNTQEHIIVDVANAIIEKQLYSNTNRNFISKIIFEGKKMYLLDAYLPEISERQKIGYSEDKLNWAKANEEEVWIYFIDRKILFSTDTKLNQRFIENAPFSKFYMNQDDLSPGRIGVWMGWQIVNSFMKHNDVSLQELLKMEEEEIFKKSKYKPKK